MWRAWRMRRRSCGKHEPIFTCEGNDIEARKTKTMPMSSPKRYILVYTASFNRHLKLVEAKYHTLIRETLENQLQYEPDARTRNRKPLNKPMAVKAEWELRFGPDNRFRVFYSVVDQEVVLLAFGEKAGNRLFIEGKEVES